jgi:hypothetical protein
VSPPSSVRALLDHLIGDARADADPDPAAAMHAAVTHAVTALHHSILG